MDRSDASVIRVSPRRSALVVDDNALFRDYIQSILQEEGYSVFAFESAIEALNELDDRNGDVSVILTDVEMPGLDGIAFAEEVNRRFCGIPVLLMSGAAKGLGAKPVAPFGKAFHARGVDRGRPIGRSVAPALSTLNSTMRIFTLLNICLVGGICG